MKGKSTSGKRGSCRETYIGTFTSAKPYGTGRIPAGG